MANPEPTPTLPEDFDEDLYFQLNPDLFQALEAGIIRSGAAHWIQAGSAEGRPYQRPIASPGFDEGDYLQMNPDVALALRMGAFSSGYDHWNHCGKIEGRIGGIRSQTRSADRFKHLPLGVLHF